MTEKSAPITYSPNAKVGIGGAPTRATTLPDDPKARKTFPIASGFLDYFPDAVAAIANLSHVGNEQHNPGQPLHWARSKSGDEADTMMRHFLQRGTLDTDGVRHSVKVCWRALAMLQKEIEAEQQLQAQKQAEPVPEEVVRPGYRLCKWHNCLTQILDGGPTHCPLHQELETVRGHSYDCGGGICPF